MKKINYIFLVLGILCTISCSNKFEENIDFKDVYYLTGLWNWTSTSGGTAGSIQTPSNTGITRMVEFTTDSIYKSYENGQKTTEKKYHIRNNTQSDATDYPYILIFENESIGTHFQIKNDVLIFNDNFVNGYKTIYHRVK